MKSNAKSMKMPTSMILGPPTLRVIDLQKELSFYENILGLQINHRYHTDDNLETVDLGFKGRFKDYQEPLLILKHDPDARETQHNFAGLFHFAILVKDRKSLASAYLSIADGGIHFDGFGDHLVSESLYLHDPEHNGIEIYRDRSRNEWQYDKEGHVVMDTLPLDLESMLSELSIDERKGITFPNGARIGHMHLRVRNLQNSSRFYQKLGFAITADWNSMGAYFLAAGNYHHHIGMNVWYSMNGKPHLQGEAGLDVFTISVQENSTIETLARELRDHVQKRDTNELLLSDPDGIQILIKST
jgi:catechol 2,3-dioxygenase